MSSIRTSDGRTGRRRVLLGVTVAVAALGASLATAGPTFADEAPATSIGGTVLFDGAPVSGAQVLIEQAVGTSGHQWRSYSSTNSQSDGTWSYDVSGLRDGSYAVVYRPTGTDAPLAGPQSTDGSPDLSSLTPDFAVSGGTTTDSIGAHELVANAGTVTITMVGGDGEVVPQISYYSGYLDEGSTLAASYWGSSVTGSEDNAITFAHVLPASYVVYGYGYQQNGGGWTSAYGEGVDVTAGADSAVTLALAPQSQQSASSLIDTSIAPAVDGVLKVGSTVSAWAPTADGVTETYRWFTVDAYYGWRAIPGATSKSLTITPDLLGQRLAFYVSYAADGYAPWTWSSNSYGDSNYFSVIAAGDGAVGNVVISGTPGFHKKLTASLAESTVEGTTNIVQWYRNGTRIVGADGSSYTMLRRDMGASITATITSFAQAYEPGVNTSAPIVAQDAVKLSAKTSGATLTFSIANGTSGNTVSGSVKVYYSATKYKGYTISGAATRTLSLPLGKGTHTVKVVYSGPSAYAAKTVTVSAKI